MQIVGFGEGAIRIFLIAEQYRRAQRQLTFGAQVEAAAAQSHNVQLTTTAQKHTTIPEAAAKQI